MICLVVFAPPLYRSAPEVVDVEDFKRPLDMVGGVDLDYLVRTVSRVSGQQKNGTALQ